MYKCKNCAAPLEGIVCTYCGVRNEVDLKHRYEVHKETERVCPNCEVFLETLIIDKEKELYIEQCKHCHGIFLDYGELEALMEREIIKSDKYNYEKLRLILDNPIAREKEVKYKKCPECRKVMSRLNYKQKSGVILDRCIEHGYWLDSGELRQMMEWAKLAGIRDFAPSFEKEITFTTQAISKSTAPKPLTSNKTDLIDFLIDGFVHFLYKR
ncbi:MAG: zf-TFIIB domain-containing protein [Epsilonproteobacteria bacterium]|nr:zf-TFIIB domain-containing protein [Campylobacterota bacterium]